MKSRLKWPVAAVVALVAVVSTYVWWLPWAGEFLVQGEAPVKADAIVVLAGDGNGYRIQAGAELARQGFAPKVLVDGSDWFYGICECEAAIDYAVRNGQPREIFEPLQITATSTNEEFLEIFREGERRKWSTVLIVTSDYHTRRTRLLANRLKPPAMRVAVFAAPDRYFRPEKWWWHRESRKTVFLEWTKLAAAALGNL